MVELSKVHDKAVMDSVNFYGLNISEWTLVEKGADYLRVENKDGIRRDLRY